MIFSYGLLYLIETVFEWEVSNRLLLGSCIFLEFFCLVRKKARENKIPMDLFVGSIAGILLFLLFVKGMLGSYLIQMLEYYSDFSEYGKLNLKYGWSLLLLVLVAGDLGSHILLKNKWGKRILAIGIVVTLVITTMWNVSWSVVPVTAWLYLCLKIGLEETQPAGRKKAEEDRVKDGQGKEERPSKEKRRRKAGIQLENNILIYAVLIIVSIIPNRAQPISWDGVVRLWESTTTAVNEVLCDLIYWDSDSEFSVANVGFSDQDNGFWGRIVHGEKRKMMEVSTYSSLNIPKQYFVASIKDDYKNNTWRKNEKWQEDAECGYEFELQERLHYLYYANIPSKEDTLFCYMSNYKFEYQNLHSSSLFLPWNCVGIEKQRAQGELVAQGPNTFFTKRQKKGSIYSVTGLHMDLKNEDLIEYLRGNRRAEAAVTENQETIFGECRDALYLKEEQIQALTNEAMRERIERYETKIDQTDLALPESIPSEVYELAKRITRQQTNDYDKVEAIVHYLKVDGDYRYTMSPKQAPKGKEEIAYFLFDEKKGYCSHFASAAAILCRCIGIPARFVEGAVAAYKNAPKDAGIYGKDAHAWTQVYLKGFGWVDVDATPGYKVEETAIQRPKENSGDPEDRQEKETLPEDQVITEQASVQKTIAWGKVAAYFGIVLAGAISLILLFFLIRFLYQSYCYRHSDLRAKYEWCMQRILLHRKSRGAGMQKEETLRGYAKRLVHTDPSEKNQLAQSGQLQQKELADCLLIYERIRYGQDPVTEDEVRGIESQWKWEAKQRRAFRWSKKKKV